MERVNTFNSLPRDQNTDLHIRQSGSTPASPPRFLTRSDYNYLLQVREVASLCDQDTDRFIEMLETRGLLSSATNMEKN